MKSVFCLYNKQSNGTLELRNSRSTVTILPALSVLPPHRLMVYFSGFQRLLGEYVLQCSIGHSRTPSVQIDSKITRLGVRTDVLFTYPIWVRLDNGYVPNIGHRFGTELGRSGGSPTGPSSCTLYASGFGE